MTVDAHDAAIGPLAVEATRGHRSGTTLPSDRSPDASHSPCLPATPMILCLSHARSVAMRTRGRVQTRTKCPGESISPQVRTAWPRS